MDICLIFITNHCEEYFPFILVPDFSVIENKSQNNKRIFPLKEESKLTLVLFRKIFWINNISSFPFSIKELSSFFNDELIKVNNSSNPWKGIVSTISWNNFKDCLKEINLVSSISQKINSTINKPLEVIVVSSEILVSLN